jgi:hypothetical protein
MWPCPTAVDKISATFLYRWSTGLRNATIRPFGVKPPRIRSLGVDEAVVWFWVSSYRLASCRIVFSKAPSRKADFPLIAHHRALTMRYPRAGIGRRRLHYLQGRVFDIWSDVEAEYPIPGTARAGRQTIALNALNRQLQASDIQLSTELSLLCLSASSFCPFGMLETTEL